MSFSYIKMFFFLSLAIVFLFILLLCYYLKNKIDVVERRVSSQTDVLGKLIREFKLQACFGYGGSANSGENEFTQSLQGIRLEPVLEVEEDDTDSDDETDYEEGADTDDDTDMGMEKVKDDELIDIDETVKKVDDTVALEEDEYKDLDFEKVANEETPVVQKEMEEITGGDFNETVCVSPEDKSKHDIPPIEKKEDKETVEEDVVLEYESIAEPKNDLDATKAESKEQEFNDEESAYRHSAKLAKDAKLEDYKKMSLVQLKHVAQHTFNLSTTQIAKMKKDDLLKWVLDQ